jgi:hypothetical protein
MALYTRLIEVYNFNLIAFFCSVYVLLKHERLQLLFLSSSTVELCSGFVSSNGLMLSCRRQDSRHALSSFMNTVNKNKVSLVELENRLQKYVQEFTKLGDKQFATSD